MEVRMRVVRLGGFAAGVCGLEGWLWGVEGWDDDIPAVFFFFWVRLLMVVGDLVWSVCGWKL